MNLSQDDLELIDIARDFIVQNYEKGRHHVACALRCEEKIYLSLHLDTKGFDVCAEPIALSNALMEGRAKFTSIAAVMSDGSGNTDVIAPCGNCRQILYEYTPDVAVIIPDTNSHKKVDAKSLLPHPY